MAAGKVPDCGPCHDRWTTLTPALCLICPGGSQLLRDGSIPARKDHRDTSLVCFAGR
jgi:hypothetical protein